MLIHRCHKQTRLPHLPRSHITHAEVHILVHFSPSFVAIVMFWQSLKSECFLYHFFCLKKKGNGGSKSLHLYCSVFLFNWSILVFIIHQIFSLACDLFKRFPSENWGISEDIPQFLKPMDNKHSSLNLAVKICSDICPWTLSCLLYTSPSPRDA